jgi:hypothetical protein
VAGKTSISQNEWRLLAEICFCRAKRFHKSLHFGDVLLVGVSLTPFLKSLPKGETFYPNFRIKQRWQPEIPPESELEG